MIAITNVWEVADEISKLQTYKLYSGGEKLVELEDVLRILRKHTKEIRNESVHIGKDHRNV